MASPPADHDPPDRTRTAPPDARRARLPAEVELAPGTRLGRYIVGARLGGGGMGVVYAAEDPELGRTIALKLVRADHAGGLAAEERFEREARAMAQLSHPHVVAVFDVGRVDGRMFLAMEHLSGGTLRAWLARRPSWSEVCVRMLEAARGLAAAHAKGIVHRDFKPENVLLDERGHARVTDFGLARVAGETVLGATAPVPTELEALTLTGTVVGTPAYMAPEQRRGEAADARSDQYSLCLTWVEALCGTRPASPRTAPVSAPRALAAILRRGLAEEPADRWPSLDALIAASERVLRRRRLAPAGVVLAGVTGVVAIAVAARPGSTTITAPAPAPLTPAPRAPAAPPNEPSGLEPVSIARKKPGDEPWVMVLDPTGTTALYWVTDRARGDRAWTEALDGGRRTELVLPEGFAIAPGYGLLRGGPRGERVFSNLALPDGREALWRLGRSGVAPRQFRPPGEPFLMCVSNDGARIAVIDDTTLEILDTESARSVHRRAISDAADCAWSWDGRLAVLRVVDGGVVIELERPGEPPVALHAPDLAGTPRAVEWGPTTDTLLVGHDLEVPPRAFVTELDVTGARRARARLVFDGTRVQNLQLTAAGLFVSTVQHVRRIEVAALRDNALGPLVPIVTRSSADADLAGWEDASTLMFGLRRGSESRSARYRLDGTLDVAATHDWEVPAGVTGGETIFARRAVRSGDTSPLRREAAEPGCGIFGRAGERTRAIAPAPCGDPSPWLRCAGVAPPCLLVEPRGLERAFAPFDPATGRREAALLVRDRQHEPNVALAPDGRFVLAQRSPTLELFDRAGKLARTITLPKIDAYDAGWMPDGRTLVVTTLGFPFQILRVTPDGRHEPLHRSEHTLYGSPRVSPDGRHLAVTAADVVPEFTLYPGLAPR